MFLLFVLGGRIPRLEILMLWESQLIVVYLARPTPTWDWVVFYRSRAIVDSRLVLPLFILRDTLFHALFHYFLCMLLCYLPEWISSNDLKFKFYIKVKLPIRLTWGLSFECIVGEKIFGVFVVVLIFFFASHVWIIFPILLNAADWASH